MSEVQEPYLAKPAAADRADLLRADHALHWILMLGAAAYAYQLHGALIALGILIALPIVIMTTNLVILARFSSFSAVRANRWFWVVLAYAVLALSRASGGSV